MKSGTWLLFVRWTGGRWVTDLIELWFFYGFPGLGPNRLDLAVRLQGRALRLTSKE